MDPLRLRHFDVQKININSEKDFLFKDLKNHIVDILSSTFKSGDIPYECSFTTHSYLILNENKDQRYLFVPFGPLEIYELTNRVINQTLPILNQNKMNTHKKALELKLPYIYSFNVIIQHDVAFISFWNKEDLITKTIHFHVLPLRENNIPKKQPETFRILSHLKNLDAKIKIDYFFDHPEAFHKIAKTLKQEETRVLYLSQEVKNQIATHHQLMDFELLYGQADLTDSENQKIQEICVENFDIRTNQEKVTIHKTNINTIQNLNCFLLRKHYNHILLICNKIIMDKNSSQKPYLLWAHEHIFGHIKL